MVKEAGPIRTKNQILQELLYTEDKILTSFTDRQLSQAEAQDLAGRYIESCYENATHNPNESFKPDRTQVSIEDMEGWDHALSAYDKGKSSLLKIEIRKMGVNLLAAEEKDLSKEVLGKAFVDLSARI